MATAAVWARPRSTWETFAPETLAALFSAVEVNDVVDAGVRLPDSTVTECTDAWIHRCFSLAWQFWDAGVARRTLLDLILRLAREGDLDAARRLEYKHIRARYKQLRFALVLYGLRHREPALFGLTVRALGRLQDAFRCGRRDRVRGYTWLFRVLLSPPLWAYVHWRVGAVRLDDAAGFRAYCAHEVARLRRLLAQEHFPGREFHEMRKIVSRQVAYYDHSRTLRPDDHAYRMSRFLSAINGLMGARHDEMVHQDTTGECDYRKALPLPHDIRWRLEAFTAAWPA